jgi:hypothetical protein
MPLIAAILAFASWRWTYAALAFGSAAMIVVV